MGTIYTVHERNDLAALAGKTAACVWATVFVDYRVHLWSRQEGFGDYCFDVREGFKTHKAAEKWAIAQGARPVAAATK